MHAMFSAMFSAIDAPPFHHQKFKALQALCVNKHLHSITFLHILGDKV
jgi:hypothetical protein